MMFDELFKKKKQQSPIIKDINKSFAETVRTNIVNNTQNQNKEDNKTITQAKKDDNLFLEGFYSVSDKPRETTQTIAPTVKKRTYVETTSKDDYDFLTGFYSVADRPENEIPEIKLMACKETKTGESRDEYDARVRNQYAARQRNADTSPANKPEDKSPEAKQTAHNNARTGESRDEYDARVRSQYTARERQIDFSDEDALRSELEDIEAAKKQDYTSKWYKRLERAWDSGDLETYERVEKEMETQRKRVKYILDNLNRRYNDNFSGQFGASYRAGRIAQDEALAWNEYLKNPTLPNREYAESVSDTLSHFRKNNEAALAEDAQAPWLSQTLAGNLPQLTDQLKAGVAGAAGTGLTSGFMAAASGNPFVAGTAAINGAKVGYAAATAAHSYDVMRGAAYKNLLAKGMDEKSAKAAANDEALISSLIELADTGVDINTVFDAITSPQKAGAKGVLKLLSKMGVNIALNSAGEGVQEGLQESISIANQQRNGTGLFDLAGEAAWTLANAMSAKDPQARQRILSAMGEGAKLSLMTAAPAIIARNAPHIADVAMTPESLQTVLDASDDPLAEMTNRADTIAVSSPIEIPKTATIKPQVKDSGAYQIKYEWATEDGFKYTSRWHTPRPDVPIEKYDTWVVEREVPGIGYGKNARPRVREVLVGDNKWVPKTDWKAARKARGRKTLTKTQKEMLNNGHWKA